MMREYLTSMLDSVRNLDLAFDVPTIVAVGLLLLVVILEIFLVVHAYRKGTNKRNIFGQFIATVIIGVVFVYWVVGLWLLMRLQQFPVEHLQRLAIEFVASALLMICAIVWLAICRNREQNARRGDEDDDELMTSIFHDQTA